MNEQTNWRGTLEMIRRASTAKGRAQSGYFSIEGIRLHERAVRAGVQVQQAVITDAFNKEPLDRIQTLLSSLINSGCQVNIVPDEIITEITGGRKLGPILGLIKMPEEPLLQDLNSPVKGKPALILAAVDVQDPGNVGALLRTAHAAGATAFIAVGISDPFHPKALRTTMGSLFKMPVLHYDDHNRLLKDLTDMGLETVGTAVTDGIPLPEAAFSKRGTAVFMGSEAWGLPVEIQNALDWLVTIPMNPGVDSFSVNAAAAIVLYEIGRGRFSSNLEPSDLDFKYTR